MKENLSENRLRKLVKAALKEDLGKGDITTAATIPPQTRCKALFKAKQDGVLAGLPAAALTFLEIDNTISFVPAVEEGMDFKVGTIVATITGSARSLLAGERTALNFLQHLSGIATLTRQFVDAVKGTGARIVDTRKTVPGLREIEKYAVRMGSGTNHRMGLYDHILLKENHFQASPHKGKPDGYALTIKDAGKKAKKGVSIIVESTTVEEAMMAARAGADIVMLDNMDLAEMRVAAVQIKSLEKNGKRPLIEASGGVTLDNVAKVAACGVDRISIGAITMAAPPIDLAMYLEF